MPFWSVYSLDIQCGFASDVWLQTDYLSRVYFVVLVVVGDGVQILRSNNNSRVKYDRRRGRLWTFRTAARNLCGRRGDISTGPRIPGSLVAAHNEIGPFDTHGVNVC